MVSYEQTHKHCRRCGRPTEHYRKATNHVLHLLLTLLTFGWWVFVWLLLSFKIGGWRCRECGLGPLLPKLIAGVVLVSGLLVTGLIMIGLSQPGSVRPSSPPMRESTGKPTEAGALESQPQDSAEPTPEVVAPLSTETSEQVPTQPMVVDESSQTEPVLIQAAPVTEEPVAVEEAAKPQTEEPPSVAPVAVSRTWTDKTGQFSIEAEFAGYASGKVKLRKQDGSTIEIPLDALSEADQKWIEERRK